MEQCLKKASSICGICKMTNTNYVRLYVQLLNKYLYFFDVLEVVSLRQDLP